MSNLWKRLVAWWPHCRHFVWKDSNCPWCLDRVRRDRNIERLLETVRGRDYQIERLQKELKVACLYRDGYKAYYDKVAELRMEELAVGIPAPRIVVPAPESATKKREREALTALYDRVVSDGQEMERTLGAVKGAQRDLRDVTSVTEEWIREEGKVLSRTRFGEGPWSEWKIVPESPFTMPTLKTESGGR